MTSIAIIDYGMGNLRSVAKAFEHVAPAAVVSVTSDAGEIEAADRIVFPGQGAIGDAMKEMHARDLDVVIRRLIHEKPFLGICLGLQALLAHSDEDGGVDGYGIFPGQVRRFPVDMTDEQGNRLKVPQMGWNQVRHTGAHPLWEGIAQDSRFYFVHSYYVEMLAPEFCAATTHYGLDYISAAGKDNIFAVQFHPEKSAAAGLKLLENFVYWNGTV
jgi:glutamine amidotransferase